MQWMGSGRDAMEKAEDYQEVFTGTAAPRGALFVFCSDVGRICLGRNAAERTLRGIALRRLLQAHL
jgi:hypothetical protein